VDTLDGSDQDFKTDWTFPSFFLLGILLTWLHWSFRAYIVDDAYIHFRIAANYFTCGRPYYDCTVPVIASSSPLWTLLLYLGAYLPGSDSFKLALLCGWTLSGTIVVVYYLLHSQPKSLSRLTTAVITVIITAPAIYISLQGMETNLAVLLLFSGALAYSQGSLGLGLFLLGLSACTRFELFVAWGIFSVGVFIRLGVRSLLLIGISLIPALLIFTGMFYYTGAILPTSMVAKEIVYQIMPDTFFDVLKDNITGTKEYAFGIIPQLTMALLGSVLIYEGIGVLRNRAAFSAIPAPLALGISGYSIGLLYLAKHVLLFPWYLPLVFTPIGYWALSYGINMRGFHKITGAAIILFPFLKAAIVSVLAVWQPALYPDLMRSARSRQYLRVGDALNKSCPDCTLLAPEIGALGYTFKGKIIDACGLISPEALKYHPIPVPEGRLSPADGAIPHGLVDEFEPEIIVSLDRFTRDLIHRKTWEKYHAFTIPPFLAEDLMYIPGGHIWGSKHLLILLHRNKVTQATYEYLRTLLPEIELYQNSY
jgi:hypothetical protein